MTREWTWNKIVRRDSGAVTVLATDPATPPLKRCFRAETAIGSGSEGGSSESSSCIFPFVSFGFVNLRIICSHCIPCGYRKSFL